jgi:Ras-related GTP-binding protein C/D
MSPHETLFLEPTNDVRVRDINHNLLVRLQVLDFPGNFDFHDEDDLDVDKIFKACGALVLVIDAQDEPYTEAVDYVVKIIETAHKVLF